MLCMLPSTNMNSNLLEEHGALISHGTRPQVTPCKMQCMQSCTDVLFMRRTNMRHCFLPCVPRHLHNSVHDSFLPSVSFIPFSNFLPSDLPLAYVLPSLVIRCPLIPCCQAFPYSLLFSIGSCIQKGVPLLL